ncbi:MAG: hypothetical protein NTX69_06555, partial [Candidatus Bipolaricaulota bacterium]|nr:hypothetical protein [Candidatus Bipolaricaulota bacterium]
LTAERLLALGLIDGIVPEPMGGAHKDFGKTADALKTEIVRRLSELSALPASDLLARRYARYRGVGRFVLAPIATPDTLPPAADVGETARN